MKNLTKLSVLLFFLFISIFGFSQTGYQDVVYLKNGSVIRGTIIEIVPDKSLKIQTSDQSIFVYKMEEIEKMTKETPAGGGTSSSSGKGKLFFEFFLGVNFASFSPDQDKLRAELETAFENASVDDKMRTGFVLGGYLYGKVAKSLFVQTGLIYNPGGIVFKGSGKMYISGGYYDVDFKETIKLDYLTIPVYIKYYINDKGDNAPAPKWNIYFLGGPNISFAISRKITADVTVAGESDSNTQDAAEVFNSTSMGFDIGAGAEIVNKVAIGLKYSFGLSNTVKADNVDNMKLNNRILSFTFGYTFP